MRRSLPFFSILYSLLCVAAGFIVVAFIKDEIQSELLVVLLISIVAALLHYIVFRGSVFFLMCTFFLPIGIYFSLVQPFASWIFLIGFCLLFSIHLPALWTHVPYYPTPPAVDDTISNIFRSTKGDLLDIGCGTGRLIKKLSRQFPERKFVGVEISLLPYLIARLRNLSQRNVSICFRSFWKEDLSQYGMIYAFLSPAVMERLGRKAAEELSSGSILLSNSFPIPIDVTGLSERRIEVNATLRGGTLFVYQKV